MTSLFELGEEMMAVRHLLEKQEDGEIDPALADWLDAKGEELERKVEGYCGVIYEFQAMAEARVRESERLADMASADQKKAARMRAVLLDVLKKLGIDKVRTVRHEVRIQNAGGRQSMDVDYFEHIPDRFQMTEVKPNREAIRRALEAGESLPFAKLLPRQQIIVIK